MPFDGGRIELAVGAEDEQAEDVVDFDQQCFAADAQFFAAGAGGVLRSARWLVMNLAEGNPSAVSQARISSRSIFMLSC